MRRLLNINPTSRVYRYLRAAFSLGFAAGLFIALREILEADILSAEAIDGGWHAVIALIAAWWGTARLNRVLDEVASPVLTDNALLAAIRPLTSHGGWQVDFGESGAVDFLAVHARRLTPERDTTLASGEWLTVILRGGTVEWQFSQHHDDRPFDIEFGDDLNALTVLCDHLAATTPTGAVVRAVG